MVSSILKFILPIVAFSTMLEAANFDIGNLNNCINEVRQADKLAPPVPTFDPYVLNYQKLLADLQAATPTLPYVYQEAAAKPLIAALRKMGVAQYTYIFNSNPKDEYSQALKQIIPDAALSILFHDSVYAQSVDAFQEVASDLYDSFISEEARVSKITGRPIIPPTYGVIPPLVKFGNADAGPYTWPCDATFQLLGMRCPIVSLPPSQIRGGLLAWSSLGHEVGGHDVLHADNGLLQELAQKVRQAVQIQFQSFALANYWAKCLDETASDVYGYLNMGPSAGIGLIGYFRSLRNGKLSSVGYSDDAHPIDLLRGHLAAAVAKRLNFKDAAIWSQIITNETNKDSASSLFFINSAGQYTAFPVSLQVAVASADLVADIIMKSKLNTLEGHSLQEIQDWTNDDQVIVDTLVTAINTTGQLPINLQGPGFYAAHVVSASVLAGLGTTANITNVFNQMLSFLQIMHNQNPTWSKFPTIQALRLLEQANVIEKTDLVLTPHSAVVKLPDDYFSEDESLLLAE